MTAEHDQQLEQALTELTTWHGPEPRLWKRALAEARSATDRRTSRFAWLFRQRGSGALAACLLVVVVGITIAVNLPYLDDVQEIVAGEMLADMDGDGGFPAVVAAPDAAYSAVNTVVVDTPATSRVDISPEQLQSLGYLAYDESETSVGEGAYDGPRGFGYGSARRAGRGAPSFGAPSSEFSVSERSSTQTESTGEDAAAAGPRHIVRKATIELRTTDVRTAFLKAALLINEATGEYVQESSITGRDDNIRANLTLRVAADRLSDVLNELRELGEVHEEQVTGQDVTTQVVDVEARLRNEQRIEVELLDLLEKRKDAPLKEILELRQSLGHVRQQIERLTAQREHLGRLVSLATVLIIIRAADTPDEPTDFSIGAYFGNGIRTAWRRGLVFLADTSGGFLSVIVGGLIWWILLALVFVAIRQYRRRRAAASTAK